MSHHDYVILISILLILIYLLAFITAAKVVMTVRSSQAAVAWLIGFLTLPYITLLVYFFFGRNHFSAYAEAMRRSNNQLNEQLQTAQHNLEIYNQALPPNLAALQHVLKNVDNLSFTHSNSVQLLIDGAQTYEAVLNAVNQAKNYVLLQFYSIRSDHIGRILKEALIKKAKAGVRIYFLYDEWGSPALSKFYLRSLRKAGVAINAFNDPSKTLSSRLQLNFRNHKKIVVVDGQVAFIGGLNIGDEYLGHLRQFGAWRDTHLELRGPVVQSAQLSFCADWYWVQRSVLNLNWTISPARANQAILLLCPGPDHLLPVSALAITQLINMATERLWIASPYFIPDQTIISALQLAVLRGVDVRILVPERADHLIVYWCSFAFYNELKAAGIKLYRYRNGFMHQKVVLLDDKLASVGTINLDNRSLYINFEITALVADAQFVREVKAMLENDFTHSQLIALEEFNRRPYWFRLLARLSRLLAPLL